MFCKQCGCKQAAETQSFCPYCGEKNCFHAEKASLFFRSFKWLAGACLSLVAFFALTLFFFPDLYEPVLQELEALKSNRLTEAYYNYTSKEFKNSVSLESFRQFVQEYPLLTSYRAVKPLSKNAEGEHGDVAVLLVSDSGQEIPMRFVLNKEGEKWKISGLALEWRENDSSAKNNLMAESNLMVTAFDAAPIYDVINEQMEKIRAKKFMEAYYLYTGKEFQKNTPYQAFEKFIKNHPGFENNKKIILNHLSFDNNIAEVLGDLTDDKGSVYPIEYNLNFEEGLWKINYVHVIPQTSTGSEKKMNGPVTLRFENK